MIKKRILIVTHLIYPAQYPRSYRSTELAKELVRQGHEVVIYASLGKYDYSEFESKYGLKVKDLGKMHFNKETCNGSRKKNIIDKILSRILGKIAYFPSIELMWRIPKALKNETGYDILISIAFPYSIHWGCAKAINKNNTISQTWIADCGDPFMGNKFAKYPFYFKFVEKWFCKKVDYLSVPIENAITAYYPEFHHKIRVIPQGFDFQETYLSKEPVFNYVTTFAYAGLFYKDKRDPSMFLEYLCSIKLDFKFIVYTNEDDLIRPYYNKLGDKIVVRPYIKREQLLQELSKMDFLLNIENVHKEQSPSKIIDYALTDRPILSINSNKFDRENVLNFLNKNYKGRLKIDINQYDIRNVAKQFIDLSSKNRSRSFELGD